MRKTAQQVRDVTDHAIKDGIVTVTLLVEHPDLPAPINAAVEVQPGELTQAVLVGIASALWPQVDKLLPRSAIIMPSKPRLQV